MKKIKDNIIKVNFKKNKKTNKVNDSKVISFYTKKPFVYVKEIPFFINKIFEVLNENYNYKIKNKPLNILVLNNTNDISYITFRKYGKLDVLEINEDSTKLSENYIVKFSELFYKKYDIVSFLNFREIKDGLEYNLFNFNNLKDLINNEGYILLPKFNSKLLSDIKNNENFESKGYFYLDKVIYNKRSEFFKINYFYPRKENLISPYKKISWLEDIINIEEKKIPLVYLFKKES